MTCVRSVSKSKGSPAIARQQPLDFADLSLFAIAGPTGAGKSSILDTMLYALYGKVPRIGKHGLGEFISHGRDRLSVCLEFALRGSRYRITRTAKRKTKGPLATTAMLAEVSGGVERSLADQVKTVNEAVAGLLGLGYEDFTQTVILPQGDFDRFLRADPKDQRAILQHLLRHDVFERMRAAAEKRRSDMDGRLKGLDGQLAMCADATAEALAARDAEVAEARVRSTEMAAAREAADVAVRDAQARRRLTLEVEQLRGQRAAIERQAPDVQRARAELAGARRAAAIMPRLEASAQAATRVDQARAALAVAIGDAQRTADARASAATDAEAAIAAAADGDTLAQRVQQLDQIAGDVARRVELGQALAALPPQLSAAEAGMSRVREAEVAAQARVQAAERRIRELRDAVAALAFDQAVHAALEAAVEPGLRGRSLEREAMALVAEADTAARTAATATKEEATARAALTKAQARADVAASALEAARAALEDGRARHRAAALRAHLHAGDTCPVCLQAVGEIPEVETAPELAGLDTAVAAAHADATVASHARQEAADGLAGATARRAEAARAAAMLTARAQEVATALAAAIDALCQVVPEVAALAPPQSPAVSPWPGFAILEERRAQVRAAKVRRDQHDADLRTAEQALAAAQVAAARAEGEARQAADTHGQLRRDLARLDTELAAVAARIAAVSTHPDPRVERDALAARITGLRQAEAAARDALGRADREATRADTQRSHAERALADAEAQAIGTGAALAHALGEAGFATADAATAAVRSQPAQAGLEARIGAFDEKRAAVLQRLADLEPQIAGQELSAEAVAAVEADGTAAHAAWREADQAVARLDAECARLREAVCTRGRLVAERDALQATHAVTAELATDLKGDRFQEYLLEEAFRALVAGASVRMKAISNRYTLDWADGNFYVVDHDNAGERRRAETLSGGETFMASLCLALQLSEEVLRTTGAVRMDSLFIDEGFGTLDADALSEVTDAIEALRPTAAA